MARINIEDSLFKDGRFLDLCIHHKDKQRALGSIVWAFIIAQKYFLNEDSGRLIPLEEWKKQQCDDKLIDVGFAEMQGNFVYVSGSEKQFAWLIQRVEAGRKGGQSKQAVAKRSLSGAKPLTPSLTPSLTLTQYSNSISNSSSTVLEKSKPVPLEFEDENALILSIDKKILDNWAKLYEQEYLQRELLKAWNWYSNNPRKKPKTIRGWIQALSSWFDRGWKHYVKNIEVNKNSSLDDWLKKEDS